jgi:fimbrial isopeptide formation D2 family protein/uncharacterized repeat protein (TIGR01451 family)
MNNSKKSYFLRNLRKASQQAELRQMLYERLEDRVLFDAVPDATLDPNAEDVENLDQANAQGFDTSIYAEDVKTVSDARLFSQEDTGPVARVSRELVIVDTSVDDYQKLVDDILGNDDPNRDIDVVTIDSSRDGIEQISRILAGFSDLDSLHIVSHGEDSGVQLGNVWLTRSNLGGYAAEIAQWGNALSSSGDILFLGCDLAAKAEGQDLLQSISTLTGADVAASVDDTGYAARGGDWDLEYVIGSMETSIAFSESVQQDWQHLLAPGPQVTLNMPASAYIGSTVNFTATFNNTGTNTGYGPFIDFIFPVNGADGAAGTSTADGLSFLRASYLGSALTAREFVFPDDDGTGVGTTGTIDHPFAVDNAGNPLKVTGTAGDKLVVIQLPFGSFVPGQPAVTVNIEAQVSNLADPYDAASPQTALTVRARAGFQYGADALNNPATDPSIVSDIQTNSSNWAVSGQIQPTLLGMDKIYNGPENETATGPNFVRSYTIRAFLAQGQTINDLTFTDFLPNTMQFIPGSLVVTSGGTTLNASQYTIVDAPGTPGAQNAPNNDLVVRLNQAVTGAGAGTAAATLTFSYFIPLNDANGTAVINATSGDDHFVDNDAAVTGQWLPTDTRDQPAVSVTSNSTTIDHRLEQQSIAIQKSVVVGSDTGSTGVTPGDELQYTLNFQVSDFFAFNNVIITDTFSDGQDWFRNAGNTNQVMVPTLEFTEHGVTVAVAAISQANYTVVENADGTTTVTFRISDELVQRAGGAAAAGELLGGWIRQGGTGTGQPDGSFNGGATTGRIVFRTLVLEDYKNANGADDSVDQGDTLTNNVVIDGALLNVDNLSVRGTRETDDSGTSVRIATGQLTKSIYAINGDTNWQPFFDPDGDGNPNVVSGDLITYRIEYTLPTSDVEDFEIVDYLPLPIFDASGISPTRIATSDTPPGANQWRLHTADTFTQFYEANANATDSFGGTSAVTIVTDSGSNSFRVQYGTVDDPATGSRKIDLLFTMPITAKPAADGLFYTNQAQSIENNTFGGSTVNQVISMQNVIVNVSAVDIVKGVVDSSNSTAFTRADGANTVTFNETSGNAGFTGTINSNWLAAGTINSNISNLDAGDTARFAVIVENKGLSRTGAYDVTIKDLLPSGLSFVAGSLRVYDGTGALLSFTRPDGSAATGDELFTTGLRLADPGATAAGAHRTDGGGLDMFDATDGRNIAVFVYDVTLTSAAAPDTELKNAATLEHYSSNEGGDNFVTTPEESEASVTTRNVIPVKSIKATSEAHTSGTDVAIGEIVRYRLQVQIPEGTSTNLQLKDVLPAGLTFLNDGTAKVALVSNTAGSMTSSTLSGSGLFQAGDNTTIGSITPTFVLPDDAISTSATTNNDTYADGTDVFFKLGNIVTTENDGNFEYVIVEFNAIVNNNQASGTTNDAGEVLGNTFEVNVAGALEATSNSANVTIREPNFDALSVTQSATTGDAGDVISFVILFRNSNTAGTATAFDARLLNTLPPEYTLNLGSISITTGAGASGVTNNSTGNTIDFTVDSIPSNGFARVEYTATLNSSLQPNTTLTDTASVTYTSLPGANGTTSNPTGSSTSGASGAELGERDGSQSRSASTNDYRRIRTASLTSNSPTIAKQLVSTEIVSASNSNTQAVIGEYVTYRVTVTVPEGTTNLASIVDTLDSGLAYVNLESAVLSSGLTISGSTTPAITSSGRVITWNFGTVTNSNTDNGVAETITLTYRVVAVNQLSNQTGTALNNRAVLDWQTAPTTKPTAFAANVTIIEPDVTVTKTVALDTDNNGAHDNGKSGDAGDGVQYTITLTNTSGVDAYDIDFSDILPKVGGGSSAILGATLVSVNDTSTTGAVSTGDFELVGSDATGYTLRKVAASNIDMLVSQQNGSNNPRVITLVVQGTIASSVTPNQSINSPAAVTWTSMDGVVSTARSSHNTNSVERTGANGEGSGLNNYSKSASDAFTVNPPVFTKQLFNTNQTETSGTNVTIGERVTYAIIVSLPEGTTPDATIIDQLPLGLRYSGFQIVTTAAGSVNYLGTQLLANDFNGTISGGVPSVTGGVNDGDDVTFTFGQINVVNDNNGSNNAFLILVDAIVTNDASNTGAVGSQKTLSNIATIDFATDGQAAQSSNTVNATVVEPKLTIAKEFGPTSTVNVDLADSGDRVTINLTVSNATGTSTAYDVIIQDTLTAANYDLSSVNLGAAGTQYPANFAASFNSSTGVLQYSGGTIAAGATVTFSFSVELAKTVTPGVTITNTANITQSTTLEGTETGERNSTASGNDTVRIRRNSLAGRVFNDLDNDGVFDTGESGIGGVQLRLTGTDHHGTAVDLTVNTLADGTYLFDILRPGNYAIAQTQPAAFLDGKDTVGTQGGNASSNDLIFNIALPAGAETFGTGNNFAEISPAALSGSVYHDANNDGFRVSETGIDGVQIRLTGKNDLNENVEITVTTAGGGNYTFTGLRPSDVDGYTITQVAEPAGYLDGKDRDGSLGNGVATNNQISSINVAPGNNGTSYNFGEVIASTLSGYVYHDSNNDGIRAGEPVGSGIANSTITLTGTDDLGQSVNLSTTTDADGFWQFTGLRPSNAAGYTIEQTSLPAAYIDGRDTIGTPGGNASVNNRFSAVVVNSNTTGQNNNFGELLPASLSGTVFNDYDNDGFFEPGNGEKGIAGVSVRLTGTNDLGQAVNVMLSTDANGNYTFTNLRPSNATGYTLTQTQPAAYTDGIDRDGSLANGVTTTNDVISSINVSSGNAGTSYNFGERGTTVSGTVYVDDDRDGVLESGEAVRVGGVTIELFDMASGSPVLVATAVTGTDGTYSFNHLPTGNYRLVQTQPLQYGNTSANTIDFTLPLTGSTGRNFGEALYDIGNKIYFDANNNGFQDASEEGLANVNVTLQYAGRDGVFGNADDPAAITVTTDTDGNYLFTELFLGNYTITVDQSDLPAGMSVTDETDDAALGAPVMNSVSNISITNADRFDVDFGYTGALSIGDTFWYDADGDGTRNLKDSDGDGTPDTVEPGLGGVTVNLTFAGADGNFTTLDDNLTLTTTTASDGTYSFDNLPEGDYRISYVVGGIPAGLTATRETDDSSVAIDGTSNISLTADRSDVDFGFEGSFSIGDRVWFDADGDGVQDSGEPGLANIGVTLIFAGADGDFSTTTDNVAWTTTTDASGNYLFDNLFNGDFRVVVTTSDLPGGAVQTFDLDDAAAALDHTANITLAGASRTDADFGYRGNGSIGDQIFFDVNNDGVLDAGDRGLPNIDVTASVDINGDGIADYTTTVTTDINGVYLFDNLIPGTYTITVDTADLPPGMTANQTFDPDGTLDNSTEVVLAANEDNTTTDFGYNSNGTIGDRVWLDTNGDGVQDSVNEPGLANVDVILTWAGGDGILGNADDEVFTTTTDNDSNYQFEFLPGGNYSIDVVQADAPGNTSLTTGNDGIVITLPTNGTNNTIDFGFVGGAVGGAGAGVIGDRVFFDHNGDGIENGDDVGYAGVDITITADIDGDGVNETFVATTDSSGFYSVPGLPYGSYTVTLTPPSGTSPSYDSNGVVTPYTSAVTLNVATPGSSAQDFGLTGTGTVGDTIFFDQDGDGVQDSTEVGIPGVTVTIEVDLDGDGTPDFTTTSVTDQDGNYSFTNIPAGEVTVTVSTPVGSNPTTSHDGVTGGDSESTINLPAGGINNDQDFGFIGTGSIGNTVFFDADSDGVQDDGTGSDPSEPGLPGVTVELDIDFNGDGMVDLTISTVTGSDGSFLFENLPAGNYTVRVTQPAGTNPTSDADGHATTPNESSLVLGAGQNNVLQNFGYTGTGSIGDTVFFDANNDGMLDAGDRGLPNIDVTASVDINGDGIADYTTTVTTDINGVYLFNNLIPGTYTITVDASDLPLGSTATFDPDGTLDNSTEVVLAANEDNTTTDFGYNSSGTIGDRVWLDTNGDGVQDSVNEPGLANVDVILTWAGGDGIFGNADDEVFTTTTDNDGNYQFEFLPGGNYSIDVVQADAPGNTSLTTGNDGIVIRLPTNGTNNTIDFGFVGGAVGGAGAGVVGDRVFFDHNGDGIENGDDVGYAGVDITITADIDGDGVNETFVATTDSSGFYSVPGLPYGSYTVTLTPPSGTSPSYDSNGVVTPNTSAVTLNVATPGSSAQDFGLTGTGTVGDTIFFDQDGDGVQDSTEVGIPGVTVTIDVDLNGDGTPDFTTTAVTDQDGNYSFTNIPAGEVTVTVSTPGGSNPTTSHDGVTGGDSESTINLPAGVTNNDQDFGFIGTGSIGNTVFFDADSDGVQDDGTGSDPSEPGLPGVTVELDIDFNGDGVVDLTISTVTGSDGSYLFENLPAGNYTVRVTQPAGTDPTSDADGSVATPNESSLVLGEGENNVLQNFGYTGTGSITDTVFFDIDNDATDDTGSNDRPLENVDVTLTIDLDGDGTPDYTTTVPTDANGNFTFTNLIPGTYAISTDPTDMPPGLANNPTVDNDGTATPHSADYVLPPDGTVDGPGFGFHATPDYEITKTTGATSAQPGDTITYTIRVRNNGELDGRNVTITDNFPATILAVSDASGGIVDNTNGVITWNLPAMQPGEEVILIVTADVLDPAAAGNNDITNTVSVTDDGYNGVDPTPTNNTSSVTIPFDATPDYVVTVTDDLDEADPGDSISYTITVANVGNQDGTGVVVTSQLKPELMTNVTPSAGGVYDPATGIVTWNLGTLDAGETVILTIDADIVNPLPFGYEETCNTVSASDDGTNGLDPTPDNNDATDTTELPVFAFDSFNDLSGGNRDLSTYNRVDVSPTGDDQYKHRLRPLPIDTVYTGIVDPGTTLSGKIYDQHGRMVGEQIVVADAAGNWLMQFPTVVLYEQPHEMRIDQTLAVHNGDYDAGFNLRRFFHPAIHSQLYMNEPISVGAAFRHDPFSVLTAMHEANNNPLGFDWKHHAYELIVSSSNTSAM